MTETADARVTLEAGHSASGAGAVTLRLAIEATREMTLEFASGQRYDFIVKREGRSVWRWSDGRAFTLALAQERLRPGDRREYAEEWPAEAAGTYSVRGIVTATGRPDLVAEVTFRVPHA